LGALCEGMGLVAPSLTPQAMIASARSGARIPVNGHDQLTLKTSRVAGSQRLEIIGAHAARLGWYKGKGCYTEIIAWKTRLFLPDAQAEAILHVICETKQSELEAVA
jgi:hypothetical protein